MKVNEAVNQLISHSTKMINACLLYAAVNLVPSPAVEGSEGEQESLQTRAGCTAVMVDGVMDL